MKTTSIISLAALAAGLAAAPALAQTTVPPDGNIQQGVPQQSGDPAADPAQAAAPAAAPDAGADTGDIVVTAQRTSSLASKTPIALSAIDGDALRNTGITNPTRLEEQVPNLAINRNNNGLQITIRGVSSADNTEKGDPSAAFLLDGIYLARPQAQEVSFYDIARVEVLRGPQGTLYGRNTTAGVVNVITNRPAQEFQAAVNGIYGNYNSATIDGMVNLPVTDWLALRFSGAYDRRDSYFNQNVAPARKLDPFRENASGRAQALFTLSPDLTILIRGDYSAIDGNALAYTLNRDFFAAPDPAQPSYAAPRYIGAGKSSDTLRNLNFALVNDPRQRSHTWGVDGELNWAFSGLALTYLGSYRTFDQDLTTSTYFAGSYAQRATGTYDQVSQELRLATDGSGPVKAQVGGYYFKETSNNTLALFNLLPSLPYYAFLQGPSRSETVGAFGQVTWRVLDRLRLTGGVRYSNDVKSRIGRSVIQHSPDRFNPATDSFTINNARIKSDRVTWRGGIDFDAGPRTLVYGSASTGYKAGGFNDGCAAGTPNCTSPSDPAVLYYRPETLTAYEIGVKTRTADNTLRFNASAFHYDYDNLQVTAVITVNNIPQQFTANAAKARIDGVELETTLAPDSRNRFDAQFTWLDARYTDYAPLGAGRAPSFDGVPLDRSPRIVAAAGYTYTLPLGNGGHMAASARTRMSDAYIMSIQSTARQYRQPGFTRTDLTLRYDAPENRYYLQGFWRNLENRVVATGISQAGDFLLVAPSEPMTYGVQAGFRF